MVKIPVLTKLTKDVRRFFGDVVAWFIPVHMKRMTFLITLYHYMMNDAKNEKLDDLEELNTLMSIAKSDAKALVIPGLFTSRIWGGDGSELLTMPEDELHKKIKARTPCWLFYGRDDDVKRDIVKLRNFIIQHH